MYPSAIIYLLMLLCYLSFLKLVVMSNIFCLEMKNIFFYGRGVISEATPSFKSALSFLEWFGMKNTAYLQDRN